MRASSAVPLTAPVAGHGEGPVWDPVAGVLRCVDLLVGDLLTVASDGTVARDHVGDVAAALRPRCGGGWVVARERDIVLLDADLRPGWSTGELWSDPGVRFNDGACDPGGAFWCGTMAYDERPGAGALWRLGPDGTVTVPERGLTVANGLAFDDDGRGALHVDTPTGRIDRLRVDPAGRVLARSALVTVPPSAGSPDGIAVDAAGGVWVALWGGGAVRHYTPGGVLDAVVELPVSRPTACALGGPDGRRLHVTSSTVAVDRVAEPLAGSVLVVDVEVPGRAVAGYAG